MDAAEAALRSVFGHEAFRTAAQAETVAAVLAGIDHKISRDGLCKKEEHRQGMEKQQGAQSTAKTERHVRAQHTKRKDTFLWDRSA